MAATPGQELLAVHPDRELLDQLPALFAGHGEQPAWPERQRAMLVGCEHALDFVIRWSGSESEAAELWRRRTANTAQFGDLLRSS